MIKEGGDLYGHYDDGTPFTNSKRKFHGIPGTVFIWHGEWSVPEVWYNGICTRPSAKKREENRQIGNMIIYLQNGLRKNLKTLYSA